MTDFEAWGDRTLDALAEATGLSRETLTLELEDSMNIRKARDHVNKAWAALMAHGIPDPEQDMTPRDAHLSELHGHLRQAWRELGAGDVDETAVDDAEALDQVGGEELLYRSRASQNLARARLLTAEAAKLEQELEGGPPDPNLGNLGSRLYEVEQKVDSLLTQEHAVSKWGQRVEARLERLEAYVDIKQMGEEVHTVHGWLLKIEERLRAVEG